jgi:predicted nucleic acid-binding protein
LPVSQGIAELWGKLSAAAEQRGLPLAVVEGVIAATALENDLTVVTRNIRDFSNLDIDLLNPWNPQAGV